MPLGNMPPVSSIPQQGMLSAGKSAFETLNMLARLYLGDPWEDIGRAGQQVSFHYQPPTETLPRHYDTAPAAPYIGPGILGLQSLLLQLGKGR